MKAPVRARPRGLTPRVRACRSSSASCARPRWCADPSAFTAARAPLTRPLRRSPSPPAVLGDSHLRPRWLGRRRCVPAAHARSLAAPGAGRVTPTLDSQSPLRRLFPACAAPRSAPGRACVLQHVMRVADTCVAPRLELPALLFWNLRTRDARHRVSCFVSSLEARGTLSRRPHRRRSCAHARAEWGACVTRRRAANMLASDGCADVQLSLPAALLKRTRCDSPGAADAHASDGACGFDEDDAGAPAVDVAMSGLGASGAAAAQQAASPPPGGKSPPRGANKSPRWRAHGSAASSPLGKGARGMESGRGAADAPAPAAASPASGADASPPPRSGEARAGASGGTEEEAEQRCVAKATAAASAPSAAQAA